MAKLAVIGAGAWGTALACQASRAGHEVHIWALEPEVADEIERVHLNSAYLPGLALPPDVRASTHAAAVLDGVACALLVVPSKHLRSVARSIAGAIPSGAAVVSAVKGIEEESLKLMGQVLAEALPAVGAERLAFLSGPSFAKEVARGLPTDVVVASVLGAAARRVQPLLHGRMFRVYASADPIGVQVGGAVKNVIAIAAGVADGLGLGANARAGLITRGLMEITRLGVALGANPLTFLGMAGVGDLVLTCTSDLSRNRTLGKKLAEGMTAEAFLASRRSVAEGFSTTAATWALARRLGVDMPITEQVYNVLHDGRALEDALRLLVDRDYKDELSGL